MVETEGLIGFIVSIVLVGLILGVGLLVFENFGDSVKETSVVVNQSITPPGINANVSLGNGNLTTFTQLRSSTGAACSTNNYSVFVVPGNLQLLDNTTCCTTTSGSCFVDYTYTEYNTNTKTVMGNMINATSPIASTWLSLIVTVMVLAIILGLVVRSFSQPR